MWKSGSRPGGLSSGRVIKTSLCPSLYMHGFSSLSGWAVKTSLRPGLYMLGLTSDMPLDRLTNHYTTLTLDERLGMLLPWGMLSLIVTLNNNFSFI